MIQNPQQGELVPCGNTDSLASAIYELLSDGKRQTQMSICEKERAKKFHPEIICSEWEKYIVEVRKKH